MVVDVELAGAAELVADVPDGVSVDGVPLALGIGF